MNHEQFVFKLSAMYGEKNDIRMQTILEWLKSNISIEQLDSIFNQIIEREQFFPMVVTIKKYIKQASGYNPDKAFEIAEKAARRVGCYNSVVFKDNRIAETIRRGWCSWTNYCLVEEETQWKRKTFIQIYSELSDRMEYNSQMEGQIEQSGSQHYKTITIDKPVDRIKIGGQYAKQLETA